METELDDLEKEGSKLRLSLETVQVLFLNRTTSRDDDDWTLHFWIEVILLARHFANHRSFRRLQLFLKVKYSTLEKPESRCSRSFFAVFYENGTRRLGISIGWGLQFRKYIVFRTERTRNDEFHGLIIQITFLNLTL